MNLSEKLILLRKKKGVSQAELAELMNVSRQAISRWETGVAVPSSQNLHFLTEFYGITLRDLYFPAEETPSPQEQVPQPQATEDTRKRKLFWLYTAAVVLVLLVGVLITAIDHIAHNEDTKEPIPMDDIQGVVIDPEEITEIEFDRD